MEEAYADDFGEEEEEWEEYEEYESYEEFEEFESDEELEEEVNENTEGDETKRAPVSRIEEEISKAASDAKSKAEAGEYHKLLQMRIKEQRERRSESIAKRRASSLAKKAAA